MNLRENNGLLNAHRMDPRIRSVVFNLEYPVDYIAHGAGSIKIAEYIANYPASDPRLSVRAAAIYCALPCDNPLFCDLTDVDELTICTTNNLDHFEDTVKALERCGSKMTAVVKCVDGAVLFGRGKYENP